MRLASALLLVSLTAACASRTSTVQTAATRPQGPAASSNASPDVLGQVSAEKKKLLATALVSSEGGPCWNAVRHAPIHAETSAEDGTPYIAPVALKIDLNGDGIADPVIEVDRDSKSVRYELYVTAASSQCARHLGTARVEGTIQGPLGTANGMKTLEVVGDGDGEKKHSELAFDGKTWSIAKRWTTPTK